ncbi:hypothetical protein YPPY59_1898, partial [Yersinia pestis PY-59]
MREASKIPPSAAN